MPEAPVVLVTGATSGIGLACVKRFRADGAVVVATGIEDNPREIQPTGADYLHCDVSDSDSVAATIQTVVARHGRIDVLINSAGIAEQRPFLEMTAQQFDRTIAVNLRGSFLAMHACARQMVDQIQAGGRPGSMIMIGSLSDSLVNPLTVDYCASKGGVGQLTRAVAVALAPHGIRVNIVAPGTITTAMTHDATDDPQLRELMLARTPLGRFGSPEEIAGVAAFLASEDASYITGETIYVDGGRHHLNFVMPRGGA